MQQAAIDSSLAMQETCDTNKDAFVDELSSKMSQRVIEDSNEAASCANMELSDASEDKITKHNHNKCKKRKSVNINDCLPSSRNEEEINDVKTSATNNAVIDLNMEGASPLTQGFQF